MLYYSTFTNLPNALRFTLISVNDVTKKELCNGFIE